MSVRCSVLGGSIRFLIIIITFAVGYFQTVAAFGAAFRSNAAFDTAFGAAFQTVVFSFLGSHFIHHMLPSSLSTLEQSVLCIVFLHSLHL